MFCGNNNKIIKDIENWDVCHISDMSYTFKNTKNFIFDISKWATFNVATMKKMFQRLINLIKTFVIFINIKFTR
ncbi:BspA family leucine-rich repeat surface protein [Williamsoniiplasma somnilux]|nr:BspA family leucine-rich repeat surface protein [Williamsoniiplasma somnilux]